MKSCYTHAKKHKTNPSQPFEWPFHSSECSRETGFETFFNIRCHNLILEIKMWSKLSCRCSPRVAVLSLIEQILSVAQFRAAWKRYSLSLGMLGNIISTGALRHTYPSLTTSDVAHHQARHRKPDFQKYLSTYGTKWDFLKFPQTFNGIKSIQALVKLPLRDNLCLRSQAALYL